MSRRHTTAGSARALAVLALGQACGQAATWAALTAALPVALARPHPAVWLSVVTMTWAAPAALIRVAGAPIDRYGPRAAGVASWVASTAAAAVPVACRPGLPVLVAVLAGASLAGGCGVAAGDVAPTWLPSRSDLARAGAWLTAGADLSVGAGALAGSSLVTTAGPRAAWLLVALLSIAAAALSGAVPALRPSPGPGPRVGPVPPVRLGVPAVLVATAGIWLGYGVVTILESLYVRRVLGQPLTVYGWLLAAWSLAGALTSAVAHRCPRLITGVWAVPAAATLVAAGEALYIGTSSLAASAAGSVLFGIGAALFGLACRAVLVTTPPARHGRVLTTWRATQSGCDIAPALVTGTLVSALGLRAVLGLAPLLSAAAVASALAATRQRGIPLTPAQQSPNQELSAGTRVTANRNKSREETQCQSMRSMIQPALSTGQSGWLGAASRRGRDTRKGGSPTQSQP